MEELKKKFRFREFQIYNDARRFNKTLKEMVKRDFPREEQYTLSSQLSRALDSILLNIAEGADRGTDKDFAHFLNNAHTSLNEVVACIDVALDSGYLATEKHNDYLVRAAALFDQLTAFRRALLHKPTK